MIPAKVPIPNNKLVSVTKYYLDRSCIRRAWKAVNSQQPPAICQDVWHAENRILKSMNRRHPGNIYYHTIQTTNLI